MYHCYMPGARELALLSGVAVLFMGLALPMWGFFRLGAMRAFERRRQSAVAPTVCLATLGALVLLQLAADRSVPVFTLYGVVVNGLWLYVVKSRGSGPARSREEPPSEFSSGPMGHDATDRFTRQLD